MESIRATVSAVLRELEVKRAHPDQDAPEALLKKALTKKEREHIKFNYFRKGILGVRVDSSVWMYQFNLKKQDLLSRLKDSFPGIKDIRLRLGG